MGSGKSTIGQHLAELQNHPFLDTDLLIEEKIQQNLKDFMLESGEISFRQNKENVFKDSKKNSSSKNNLTKTVFFVALLTVAGYVLLNETKQGNKLLALLK